jgi:hypothetical protein
VRDVRLFCVVRLPVVILFVAGVDILFVEEEDIVFVEEADVLFLEEVIVEVLFRVDIVVTVEVLLEDLVIDVDWHTTSSTSRTTKRSENCMAGIRSQDGARR